MNKYRTKQKEKLKLFVVSDSIGETAQRIINAVLAQFPDLEDYEVKKVPFVDSPEMLLSILSDALNERAIVVTTLVDKELNQLCADFSKKTGLDYVDYMSDLMRIVFEKTHVEPTYESGALYLMNQDYFNRVEAIEFAVRYDDGKDPKGFQKSDVVVLGISRTSKTPLSMYLANRSVKVANLPLIPEVSIPKELHSLEDTLIIGLTASPEYIMRVRQSRLDSLGLDGNSSYVAIDRIKKELSYAHDLYSSLGATIINVENRSIEETAQLVEEALKK